MLTLNDLKELLKELNKSSNFGVNKVVFYSDGSGRFETEDGGLIVRFRDIAKLTSALAKIEGFND